MRTLRIISRRSPLAMWQAEHVRERLQAAHPGLRVDIDGIATQADRFLDTSLPAMGGKGVFVKELEQALLDGAADMAVHSMKDVPVELAPDLALPVMLPRADARDVLISRAYPSVQALPAGARVGTSSLRRRSQLLNRRPDLRLMDVRGNVGTRLEKLDRGDFDALILAAAGLGRLGFSDRIREYLDPSVMLPAAGQGVMGIECRRSDELTLKMIRPLDNPDAHACVLAERAVGARLFGGCHLPLAAYARIDRAGLILEALVASADGSRLLRSRATGAIGRPGELGDALGRALLAQGAGDILKEIGHGV
ncbi:MAG: hydroxymethylbilane synthase [Gammaproteobacteria bacterium]|nr:hydroxymethylbilane synthase [Gammaproteobacteria bacterium]